RPLKRLADVVLAAVGLALTSPLAAWAWIRIFRDRDGPVIYRGRRVGLHGREFDMYKFRTMVPDADRIGGASTADDDARLTPTGRLLRKYKLDELPQLLNVLKGEMSLVGPRPQVPSEVASYTDEESELLTVRPGLTDWASIRFHNEGEILRGHADPEQAYAELIRPEKMRLALDYVRRAGALDDLRIMIDTLLIPRRSRAGAAEGADYSLVTETWGLPASPEQLEMQATRYGLAAQVAGTGRVLEVGCGSGMGLAFLRRRGADAFGGDYTMAL